MSIKRFVWIPVAVFLLSISIFVNYGRTSVGLAENNHALSSLSLSLTKTNAELGQCIAGIDTLVRRVQSMERLLSRAEVDAAHETRTRCLAPTLDRLKSLLGAYRVHGGGGDELLPDLERHTRSWLVESRRILGIERSSSILTPHAFERLSSEIGERLALLETQIRRAPALIARHNYAQVDSLYRVLLVSLVIFSTIMVYVITSTRRFVADIDRFTSAMKALCRGDMNVAVSLGRHRGELRRLADGVMAFRAALERVTRTEERYAHLANHDPLTGIFNRRRLIEYGEKLIGADGSTPVIVLKIDLDRFKQVNDTYGHAAGDAFLVDAVRAMQSVLRSHDVLARLGGDEFAAVLVGTDAPASWPGIVERLLAALGEPVAFRGQPIDRSASIGISAFPDDGRTLDELLASADVALYAAKSDGRGRAVRVDGDMVAASQARIELSRAIEEGVARGEFTAWFQPKIAPATGRITGFEALARWNHAERGVLGPYHFIEVAESSDLILRIGEQVLEETMRAVRRLKAAGHEGCVTVNASERELGLPGYAERFLTTLRGNDIDVEAVSVELLETVAFEGAGEQININLRRLNEQGVTLWIDDFGIGFSTVSVLQRDDIGGIKIDRRFVCSERSGDKDKALLDTIVRMAKAMGKECVLEGVETEEELRYSRQIGCDIVQGYCYARPMPLDELLIWLREYGAAETDIGKAA